MTTCGTSSESEAVVEKRRALSCSGLECGDEALHGDLSCRLLHDKSAGELDLLEPDLDGADDDELRRVAADLARNMFEYHYGIDIRRFWNDGVIEADVAEG
jgi:hypothetical protein